MHCADCVCFGVGSCPRVGVFLLGDRWWNSTLNADVPRLSPALNAPTELSGLPYDIGLHAVVRQREYAPHAYEQLNLILPQEEKLCVHNSPLLNADLIFKRRLDELPLCSSTFALDGPSSDFQYDVCFLV